MNPIYRFGLTLDINGVTRDEVPVFPNYKDDLGLDYDVETQQRFYRTKLSGKVTFIRDDFRLINDADFETKFIMRIYVSDSPGQWRELHKSSFMKTDCIINDDDKTITVQPNVVDEYNDVLSGLEKEFNLVKLAPKIKRLIISKRPLIQVYVPGDSVVSCFLSGSHWEQDANIETNTNTLVTKYHFALNASLREIEIKGESTPDVSGVYSGALGSNYISKKEYYIKGETIPYGSQPANVFSIYDMGDKLLFQTGPLSDLDPLGVLRFMPKGESTGTPIGGGIKRDVYARYICDVEKIGNLNTYPIPSDDIVDNNRNYKRAIGYAVTDVIQISSRVSSEPTEWGLTSTGGYFKPPFSIYNATFFPVARSTWGDTSIWFNFSLFDFLYEEKARKKYVLRDTFTLASCINVLLREIAPGITHEATPEYSQFLYGSDEFNEVGGFRGELLISQKSNIINGEYQSPAQKAPITLRQILNALRDMYKCYWFIDNGKLRIEQVEFFRNGGTYNYNPVIGFDLTKLENLPNGKKWGFGTSEYNFDKVDMAERYQFQWQDDVTEIFQGLPIEIESQYVEQGKIEEINISNFSSDIDLMQLNPSAFSKDGFAIFSARSGNAIMNPDTIFSMGSTGTNGYTSPLYEISPEFMGYSGIIIANGSGGGTGSVVFYDKSGGIIEWASPSFISQGDLRIPISIPQDASKMGYKATGTIAVKTFKIDVSELPELPFLKTKINNTDFELQNGWLAMAYLHPTYWVYDMPATRLRINNEPTFARSVERKKKQTLKFPAALELNPMLLVKTYLGDGQIEKINVNLCSSTAKTTLKYDTTK